MSDNEDRQKAVDNAIAMLMEHFDAVQILVSWQGESGSLTHDIFRGRGNWYARTGMAHDFLKNDEARTIGANMPRPESPPDDGEEWKPKAP